MRLAEAYCFALGPTFIEELDLVGVHDDGYNAALGNLKRLLAEVRVEELGGLATVALDEEEFFAEGVYVGREVIAIRRHGCCELAGQGIRSTNDESLDLRIGIGLCGHGHSLLALYQNEKPT